MDCVFLKQLPIFLFLVSLSLISAEEDDIGHQLREAIFEGNLEAVQRFFDEHPTIEINKKGADGSTLMHIASIFGNKEMLDFLLDKGANLLAEDTDGALPFHFACQYGNPEGASWFLSLHRSIDFGINRQNKLGRSPFMNSVRETDRGDAETKEKMLNCQMMLLRDDRIDINLPSNGNRSPLWNALIWADSRGFITEELLKHDHCALTPLVNGVDGLCMLLLLASKSSPVRELKSLLCDERIRELIEQDALNIVNRDGISCLGKNVTTGEDTENRVCQVEEAVQALMLQAWQERQTYYRDLIKSYCSEDVASLIASFVISSDPVPFGEFDIPDQERVG